MEKIRYEFNLCDANPTKFTTFNYNFFTVNCKIQKFQKFKHLKLIYFLLRL